jgi:thermolabile hemolysin
MPQSLILLDSVENDPDSIEIPTQAVGSQARSQILTCYSSKCEPYRSQCRFSRCDRYSTIYFIVRKYFLISAITLLTFIMIALASSHQPAQNSPSIDHLYIFGDSLSDTGNVFKSTNQVYPPSPAYFQGRYSNGQVWVEYLGKELGVPTIQQTNFAYGGATTGTVGTQGVPGLLTQVQQFLQRSPKLEPNAAYLIWAGANDYLNGVSTPTQTVENVKRSLTLLQQAGAKKLLVANLPDLGRLPATRNTSYASALSSATMAHNTALANALQQFNQNGQQVVLLDANRLYRDAIASPAKFGFTNVTSACLNNAACKQPNQFLFWDGIHPTTAAHQLLAKSAFQALTPELASK